MTERCSSVVSLCDVTVVRDGRTVLDGISLDLVEGEFLGLCGPNGAGKSTLLRVVLGLQRVTSGMVSIFGGPVRLGSPPHGVGYVPQRQAIPADFPATVADIVLMGRICCFGPLRRPSRRDREQVLSTLERVGIEHLADRAVGRLSGGEQRRVLLAQALCAETRLLVLDEPTIGLDLPAEQEFYALLKSLRDDLGLTIFAVSHDLVALASAADSLACLNRTIHVHGDPREVVHSHALQQAYSCEFDFLASELAHHEGRTG